jgi:hypothetical protein
VFIYQDRSAPFLKTDRKVLSISSEKNSSLESGKSKHMDQKVLPLPNQNENYFTTWGQANNYAHV